MNKRRWTLWSIICLTGAPWMGIFTTAGICLKSWYTENYVRGRPFDPWRLSDIEDVLWLAALGWMIVVFKNMMWLKSDRPIGLLTWIDKYKYEPPSESSRKRKAQYPDVPDELLSDEPDGLVLGRVGKRFLRVPLKIGNILNAVILGSAGTGKSTILLTILIYQLNHARLVSEYGYESGDSFEPMTFYATDIKPELARKSTFIEGNPRVRVMDPQDRSTYGWDVYYNLSDEATDDEILEELDVIARALIDEGKSDKNAFFYEHARTIMKAILFWAYKQGRSFMQGMDYIMTGSIETVIMKTLEKVEDKPEYAMVLRLLSPYKDKKGEAFEGIELAFRQSLDILNQHAVRFFLDSNPRKASPEDLEQKISVFFSLKETKLEEYRALLRLVTMQIMHHCSGRPETSHMLTLVVDEAARIGIDWTSFLSTSRSRQVATILAFQSINQAYEHWGKENTKSLLELCRITAILSCTDPDMAKMLSDWVGDYKEERRSVNDGGKNSGSYSTSYEDKRILTQADIMTLQDKEEVLLFIKGEYFRTNVTQARYYNIPELNEISNHCLDYNDKGGK